MSSGQSSNTRSVGLFVTCLADLFRPQVGFAAMSLLESCGCEVSVPVQSCCGQPAYNTGNDDKARMLARNFIEAFEPFDYVVAPSGSCSAMVKIHYPALFEAGDGWRERAESLAGRTWELSCFLDEVLDEKPALESFVADSETKFCYHDSCSGLRELGVRSQPRNLLKQHCGLSIDEMHNAEICCGFGGTFCVKYPEISTRMVDNKLEGAMEAHADVILGGDLGCLMNIAGRLKRQGSDTRVYHYAELLAEKSPGPGIGETPESED